MNEARLKLDWASGHLDSLWGELESYMASEPLRLRSDTNLVDPREFVLCRYFVDELAPIPSTWPLQIDGIIGDFRAVLEFVAWRSVAAEKGPEFAKKKPGKVSFPVELSASGFDKHFVTKHTSPRVQAVMRNAQPFVRNPREPKSDPLWVLHELARRCRHQRLHVVAFIGRDARVTTEPPLPNGTFKLIEKGELQVGDELARFTAPSPRGWMGNIQFLSGVEVVIDGKGEFANVPLHIGLDAIRARVAEVVDACEDFE